MVRKRRRVRRFLLLAVGALVTVLGVGLYLGDVFSSLENQTVDARFSIRGEEPPPRNMALVLLDDASYSRMGTYLSRKPFGQVVEKLDDDGAKLVVMDFDFPSSHKWDSEGDRYFADALTESRPVVLTAGTFYKDGRPVIMFEPEDIESIGHVIASPKLRRDLVARRPPTRTVSTGPLP